MQSFPDEAQTEKRRVAAGAADLSVSWSPLTALHPRSFPPSMHEPAEPQQSTFYLIVCRLIHARVGPYSGRVRPPGRFSHPDNEWLWNAPYHSDVLAFSFESTLKDLAASYRESSAVFPDGTETLVDHRNFLQSANYLRFETVSLRYYKNGSVLLEGLNKSCWFLPCRSF